MTVEHELRKRFLLNLLIQGSATHTYLDAHRRVESSLIDFAPELVAQYDRLSIYLHLSQWQGDLFLFLGNFRRFWDRIAETTHPFSGQPFFLKYGKLLSEQAFEKAKTRARELGISHNWFFQWINTYRLLIQTRRREQEFKSRLEALAMDITSSIWGIWREKLRAELSMNVAFGNLQVPRTVLGKFMRQAAIGYGGVANENSGLTVVARAWVFPLLVHELTKGTAELICLHGLNHLPQETYDYVTREADQLEHEIWMIQAGSELWSKLLECIPHVPVVTNPVTKTLMHVARMPPLILEQFLFDLMENPRTARGTIADCLETDL